VLLNDTLYWDFLRLFHEIKKGLVAARDAGGFDTVGVDTWGVDFGLIDASGRLLENPVHYRDHRTDGVPEEIFRIIPRQAVYGETGIQILNLNTLFQFYSLARHRPELVARAAQALFTPDLINYFLSGVARTEYTISSTSAMLRPVSAVWSEMLTDRLGLPAGLFAPVVDAGTPIGSLSDSIRSELSLPAAQVIAVASHDTASAVIAVPSLPGEETVFISSGTWSVMGIESPEPIISDMSYRFNFSNEGGYGRNTRFLKNIMGLWLIQETRRQWMREGKTLTYGDMEREALLSEPFRSLVNPDSAAFAPMGDMPGRIRAACQAIGEPIPLTVGEVTRCIYESLALKYRMVKEEIETLTGHRFDRLRVVGGGVKDGLLSQFTADATGARVVAGPIEATALGNIAVQLIAAGVLPSKEAAREAIRLSFDCLEYSPAPERQADWDAAYRRFQGICG
jgi:rhamnulokinase